MFNHRWHSLKILEGDKAVTEKYPIDLPEGFSCDYEKQIIKEKYDFIEEIVREVLVNKEKKEASTDKIDSLLTNRWLGFPSTTKEMTALLTPASPIPACIIPDIQSINSAI